MLATKPRLTLKPELYKQMREVEDQHWWFQARRKIVESLLSDLEFPNNPTILDLGCGTGGNLEMLSRFGSVTGIEMDQAAAAIARERNQATVLEGFLPDGLPAEIGTFNCVTMLDVLEHIQPDQDSLRVVNTLLEPGGYLALTVPAFQFLWGPHDEAHHHHRRYRAPMLRSRLVDAGFKVRKLTYCNTWLFPLVAAVRMVRKIVPAKEAGLEVNLPPPVVNKILETVFSSERAVLKRAGFPFGVSLLALGQKASQD